MDADSSQSEGLSSNEWRALQPIHWSALVDILVQWRSRIRSNWAIVLVKFNDDPVPNPPRQKYERLFTVAGLGSQNMVDFFRDMSHGRLDLSGSQVFGWFTLPVSRSTYVGNVYPPPIGKLNRNGLVDLARATATSQGVDLDRFQGVVVSAYGSTDLCGWIGGFTALCDENSLQPSLLGQEMGHGFGLDHARRDGSTADYQDPWDVMSTAAFPGMQHPHSEFTSIGPGLNAWNMRSRAWLDESRVWVSGGVDVAVTLRPLHHPGLAGWLAVDLGPYLAEFRVPELWDAGLDEACVLVHRFEDNHSYLMTSKSGNACLRKGDVFEVGHTDTWSSSIYRVIVDDIDPIGKTAALRVWSDVQVRRIPEVVGTVLGGVAVGGDGLIVINGKIVRIPPRGPARELLSRVARFLDIDAAADPAAAASLRRTLMSETAGLAIDLYGQAEKVSHHPPGYRPG